MDARRYLPVILHQILFHVIINFRGALSKQKADCDEAIAQIIAEKYAQGLYGYTQVFCYGISFFQKQAKVKKLHG